MLVLLAVPVMADEKINARIKELQAEGQQVMNNKQQAVQFIQQADIRINQIAGALDELNKLNAPPPAKPKAEKDVNRDKMNAAKTGDKNWDEEK